MNLYMKASLKVFELNFDIREYADVVLDKF